MESGQAGPELVPLGGILPMLTGFIAYSEAGLLVPEFCTLNGVPVGWANSGYDGVADGRANQGSNHTALTHEAGNPMVTGSFEGSGKKLFAKMC
jgi:hypothetical protein